MGTVELIVLIVSAAAVIVVGMLIRSSRSRPAATPTLAPARPREPIKARPHEHQVVQIHRGDLRGQLRRHAAEAELRGLRPFVEFGAVWCPPSSMFGRILGEPSMAEALAGVYLIRAESDDFGADELADAGLRVVAVPVFFELDAEGEPTGRTINGGAWGADTIENMSRVMGKFFAGS